MNAQKDTAAISFALAKETLPSSAAEILLSFLMDAACYRSEKLFAAVPANNPRTSEISKR